jgi:hypothetical protein
MGRNRSGKGTSAAVKLDPFPTSAKQDYPITKWETEGRLKYDSLRKNKPKGKLNKYELYLLQHHFPKQELEFATHDAKRRKAERKRRHSNTGLAGADASEDDSPAGRYARPSAKVLVT